MLVNKDSTLTYITSDTVSIIELHQNEIQLIKMLRTQCRFGEVVIKVQDGIPMRLIRMTEFFDLDRKPDNTK